MIILFAILFVGIIAVCAAAAVGSFRHAREKNVEWWYTYGMYLCFVGWVVGGAYFTYILVSELVNYA